ncbi:MAG: DUF1214 domain-containing protein [Deltaproteobacteria bacterium]|nr:DUF1214 domain-containing protein [Deltaproteobacteria bacterium]
MRLKEIRTCLSKSYLMVPVGVFLASFIAMVVLFFYGTQMTILNPNGWLTVDDIGSKETDFISRAVIAKIGLFANSKDKTIYLSSHPNKGIDFKKLLSGPKHWFTLNSKKHYQIIGNINIPSAWWSITLYNDKDLLVKNSVKTYSYTNYNLVTDPNGDFVIDVASVKPEVATNWLPSPTNTPFNLKMRIYEPSKEVYENIGTYPLPKLKVRSN